MLIQLIWQFHVLIIAKNQVGNWETLFLWLLLGIFRCFHAINRWMNLDFGSMHLALNTLQGQLNYLRLGLRWLWRHDSTLNAQTIDLFEDTRLKLQLLFKGCAFWVTVKSTLLDLCKFWLLFLLDFFIVSALFYGWVIPLGHELERVEWVVLGREALLLDDFLE